jgi:hypothetical protein
MGRADPRGVDLSQAVGISELANIQTPVNTITVLRTSDYSQFVRPPTADQPTREDFLLTGLVIVHLDRARCVKALSLRFVTEVILRGPGEYRRL